MIDTQTPPKFYLLFGAPGSGKSSVLHYMKRCYAEKIEIIAKETTRAKRQNDSFEVVHVNAISDDVDVRYTQYGTDYGFRSEAVWSCFKKGKSVAVIVNDMRTIKLLLRKFGSLARTIYVHSNVNSDSIRLLAAERHTDIDSTVLAKDIEKRINKIKTTHSRYIENSALITYTILNIGSFSDLEKQVDGIIHDHHLETRRQLSPLKLFVIAGASYSGKDELVKALQQMDAQKVNMYQKGSNRPKRKGDADELLHFPKGIPDRYDIQYTRQGYIYSISTEELWSIFSDGKIALVVVSDLDVIKRLKQNFGSLCSVLHLHASFNIDEIQKKMIISGISNTEYQARLSGIKELQQDYIENISIYDHVLLNTAEKEDLYDQASNLLEHYCY